MSVNRSKFLSAVAAGALLVSADAALAAEQTGANAVQLDQLLSDIAAQQSRLDEQTRQMEIERQKLREQAAELQRLREQMQAEQTGGAKAKSVAETQAPATVKTTQSVPREAPARPRTGTGYTAKNVHTDGPAAKTDLPSFAGMPSPYVPEDAPREGRETLRDVVRRAVAPTLAAQTEVGQRPEENDDEIDIAVIADRGGVLTPRGTLVIDPSLDYNHSSVNRFFFDGVEIVDAVLIGVLEAQDINRDSVTTGIGMRYGLTRRMEFSARTSWTYRDDRTDAQVVNATGARAIKELDGSGFGDLDFGLNYQINKPKGNFPYFVANARFKTNTGKGPFDVDRNLQTGLEEELPTGSGFWTIEPSLTVIYPTDPAVLFANIGYQYTVDDNVNTAVLDRCDITAVGGAAPIDGGSGLTTPRDLSGEPGSVVTDENGDTVTFPSSCVATFAFTTDRDQRTINSVNPGDAISMSVGMGIGLNDSVSLSLGYEHTWVFGTETNQTRIQTTDTSGIVEQVITRGTSKSADAQVGALLIGASISVADNVGLNFNVAVGVTDDSPDVRLSLRTPLSWRLFKK